MTSTRSNCSDQLPILQNKRISSPVDAVAPPTCDPDERRNQVPQRQQENIAEQFAAENLAIVEHDPRSSKSNAQPRGERQREQQPRPRGPVGRQQRQQCPWQSEGEKQSGVSPAAGIANGSRPAQLMAKKLPQRVGRSEENTSEIQSLR